jgi:hypothetical protein
VGAESHVPAETPFLVGEDGPAERKVSMPMATQLPSPPRVYADSPRAFLRRALRDTALSS